MKLMKAERQNIILDILNKEKKIIAKDISTKLNVSEDTIRRDLNELDEKGLLKRVHSGAIKRGPKAVDFSIREDVNIEEKIRLAKKAVKYIKPDSVILIDGGTTNYQLIKQIPKDFSCIIITNSIPIISLLKYYPNIKVLSLGGFLHKQSLVNIGYETIKQLESIHADMYFMGISHIDSEIGITIVTLEECQTKQKMIEVSSEVISMVTKDKLETVSNFVVGKTGIITNLVLDD